MREDETAAAGEMVCLVDEKNNVLGAVPRRQMREQRLLHRATYIFVFHSSGQLYVQRRTMNKDLYPGYWDPAAGGVLLAGESYEESARRELEEEFGVRNVPLESHFDFYFEDVDGRVWGGVFSCVYDGELKLQADEVQGVQLMTIDQIFAPASGDSFAPDSLEALRLYVEHRRVSSAPPS